MTMNPMTSAHEGFPHPPQCEHIDLDIFEKTINLLDAVLKLEFGEDGYTLRVPKYTAPQSGGIMSYLRPSTYLQSPSKKSVPKPVASSDQLDHSTTPPSSETIHQVTSVPGRPVVRVGYSSRLDKFRHCQGAQCLSVEAGSDNPSEVIILFAGYGWGTPAYYSTLVHFLRLSQSEEFIKQNKRICLLDWLGTAGSSRPQWTKNWYEDREKTTDWFADSVYFWCQHRHYIQDPNQPTDESLPSLIVGGHSVGAYYITKFANQYKIDNIKKLLLLSPCGFGELADQMIDPKQFPTQKTMSQSVVSYFMSTSITPFEALRFFGRTMLGHFVAGYVKRRAGIFYQRDEQLSELMTEWLTSNYDGTSSADKGYSSVFVEVRAHEPIRHMIPELQIPEIEVFYGSDDWMDPIHSFLTIETLHAQFGGDWNRLPWSRIDEPFLMTGPRLHEEQATYTMTPRKLNAASHTDSKYIKIFGIEDCGHQIMLDQGALAARAILGMEPESVVMYGYWKGIASEQLMKTF